MIGLEKVVRLSLLVTNGPEGAAEAEAETEEEKQFVAEMRTTKGHGSMIQTLPFEFDFNAEDSPDFDRDAWEEAGSPPDRKWEFVREYTPPPVGWMPKMF